MNKSIAICMLLLSASCASAPGRAVDNSTEREFFRKPVAEQMATFRMRNVQEQLAIYYFGSQVRHPPSIYLADCFALNGAEGVTTLRAELGKEIGELQVRDISSLLVAIDSISSYDVAADDGLMAMLRKQQKHMNSGGWKETVAESIAMIESGRYRRRPGSACH